MQDGPHDETCRLSAVHWLRHAIAACTRVSVADDQRVNADRLAAASLLNALEHFADHHGWAGVTLRDVAEYATLMGDKSSPGCTCRDNPPRAPRSWPI